jgi:hypothetical protein
MADGIAFDPAIFPRRRIASVFNQPHKPALERGQHAREFMTAFQHCAMFADKGEGTLFHAQLGAFFDAYLGALGGSAESSKTGDIATERHCIITPVPSGDHPSVEVENPLEF